MWFAETTDGQRISTLGLHMDLEQISELARQGSIVCPECHAPMGFRKGEVVRPHFYHRHNTCSYLYWENESEEHESGKLLLAEWLRTLFPEARVELEFRVESTRQRTDVMLIHPDGTHYAFEFQCASISPEIWRERHNLYRQAHIRDTWILGASRLGWSKYGVRLKDMDANILLEAPILCAGKNSVAYLDVSARTLMAVGSHIEDKKPVGLNETRIRLGPKLIVGTERGLLAYDRQLIINKNRRREQQVKMDKALQIGLKNWGDCPRFHLLDNDLELKHPEAFTRPQLDWKLFLYQKKINKAIGRKKFELSPIDCLFSLEKNHYVKEESAIEDIRTFLEHLVTHKMLLPLCDDGYAVIVDNLTDAIVFNRPTIIYPLLACPSCGEKMKITQNRIIHPKYGAMSTYEIGCDECGEFFYLSPPLCKRCKRPLVLKSWKSSPFWGCSQYDKCTYTVGITLMLPEQNQRVY